MAKTTQTFYENSVYKFRDTEAEIDIDVFDNTAKGDITEVTASQRRLAHLSEVYDGDRDIPQALCDLPSTINFCLTDP